MLAESISKFDPRTHIYYMNIWFHTSFSEHENTFYLVANFLPLCYLFLKFAFVESREIEYVLNEVIERIDDEEAIQRLVANMHNFVDLLNECHGLFLSKPTGKIYATFVF